MSPQNVLVSIVIPTFLEERNIERCLKSVRNQDFGMDKIEVIVVDSKSFDKTKAIAKKYADKVIDINGRGVGKARNVGAKIGRGEILLFLDADTVLDSGFVTKIYESFSDSNMVCVSGRVTGLERLGTIDNLFKFFHYSLMNKISIITARLGFPFFPTVCCACRKSAFHRIGGFDEGLAVGEDIVFSLRMGKVGKCLVNKKATAYTSLRRVKKNGRLKNYFLYFKNYFKIFVLNEKPWIQDFPHTLES